VVCHGHEIGGGVICIHQPDVQRRVFRVVGISDDEVWERFGFLREALGCGPPPHGGIAWGGNWICKRVGGADLLREVIAVSQSGGGLDPLPDTPAFLLREQRTQAGVDTKLPATG
jgi:aspartyl-tRNA synthetase